MKFGRPLLLSVAMGCACSVSAIADQPAQEPESIAFNPEPARIVSVHRIPGGRDMPQRQARPRGTVIGFDNLNLPGSAAGLNVAYTIPASYTSPPPASSNANIFGLGNGAAGSSLRAPSNPAAVPPIPNPTDIVWNDYTGDATVWPGGAGVNAGGVEFDFVRVAVNPGGVARIDTVNILFFNADGTEFIDGFGVDIDTPAGAAFYQRVNVDLTGATPAIEIPQEGLVMIDYIPPSGSTTIVGVGLAFEGGDTVDNANYPTPQSLVQVGTEDPLFWVFADHTTGNGGPPAVVDPAFDGDAATTSYLDVLNTGQLIDWAFTSATPPPPRNLAHGFPILLMVGGEPVVGSCTIPGLGCLNLSEAECTIQGGVYGGDGSTCPTGSCQVTNPAPACIVTTELDCLTLGGVYGGDGSTCCACDFNNDSLLNSQDFFDFLACFFTPPCDADFNNDTNVNSQDFFDFLACFFAPPAGC